jgi:LmbE family N-acetylglucosaminyl deacetylase
MKRRMVESLVVLAIVGGYFASTLPRRASAQATPETVQAINKARIATRILFITAHPDDETAGLLAYLSRGLYADVALLTVTRGQGGQNAVGPEQDAPLGVIRTTELLAADKQYGVEQYFTRAVDPGFSKSPERTMKIWGEQIPLEDMVRVIRTYRPQVVINGWGGVHTGHGQHQASGILTPKAVADAADPKMFPEQIAEGLAPWKVTLELRQDGLPQPGQPASKPSPAAVQLPVGDVSALWGESYTQMGADGHEAHRSQGTPALFGNAFFRRPVYLAEDKDQGAEPFDVKVLAEPIESLATRFPNLQSQIEQAAAAADQEITAASKSALGLDRAAAAKSLAAAGKEIARLQETISKSGDEEASAAGWEVARVRERIDRALREDVALPVAAQSDKHELVAGEAFTVEVIAGRPAVPLKYEVNPASFTVPNNWKTTAVETKPTPGRGPAGGTSNPRFEITIPDGAAAPVSAENVILPFPPPLVKLALRASLDDYEFTIEKAVQSQVAKTTGVVTYELELVPAVTLTANPTQIVLPAKNAASPVTLFTRVRYHGTRPAKVSAGLDAPAGWRVQDIAPLDFKEAGDQLLRYIVTPPAHVAPGAYPLRPYAKIGEQAFRTSLEPIPTLPTRDWGEPDDAVVHVFDLNVPGGLRVGYVAAGNDPVPENLRQTGIQVDLLDEAALAFGDLSHYDAIVVGIRAYELRPDLMSMNARVLDYVHDGGTLLVQYQRDFAWNKLLPAPFPVKMADQAARVTDADSPVRFLAPDNPLLNSPNKITQADFQGWVQERGLYLLDKINPPYEAVLALKDFNEPETMGGLVYARDGKGVYIYTGLSFFRQLPAGVPGAYRLFVNLLSQTPHTR